MPEVITLGETLVVFDSLKSGPLRYASQYDCHTGGAETTVAVGVVRQGHTAGWISRLGDDEFGKLILRVFRGEGLDVSQVESDSARPTGIFFRQDAGNGEYKNFYYRKGSAASAMTPEMLDESYIASCKYFHVSGVTLAISEPAAATAARAMELAKRNEVAVCFDPNLRLKMWSAEEARRTMERLWPLVDIALPGAEEGEILFGTSDPDKIARELEKRGVGTVIVKVGKDGAIGYRDGKKIVSPGFPVKHVVDAFGAGDSFAAGVLAGNLKGWSMERTLELANAIGAIAVSAPGNIEALPTYEEAAAFLKGKTEAAR